MDKSKLLKLLRLTQSDNDHGALLALRKANKLLSQSNQTWDSILEDLPKPKQPNYQAHAAWERPAYKEALFMLEYIFYNAPAWFDPTFTDSLTKQLYSKKYLTQKQTLTLHKIYNKIKGSK